MKSKTGKEVERKIKRAEESLRENAWEAISALVLIIFGIGVLLKGNFIFTKFNLAILLIIGLAVSVTLFFYKLSLKKISAPELIFAVVFIALLLLKGTYNWVLGAFIFVFGIGGILQSMDILKAEEKLEIRFGKK